MQISLAEAMQKKGLRAADIVRSSGIQTTTMWRIQTGITRPHIGTKLAISHALHMHPDEIIFPADDREYKPAVPFPITFTVHEEGYFRRHEPELMAEVDQMRMAWTREIGERWRIHLEDLKRDGVAITHMRGHLRSWMAEQAGTEPASTEGTARVRRFGERTSP
jgi:transcriptional regulator with XRE-family HTH domain